MEIRCKSIPSFLACKHLSELGALVTVLRSVWVTLDLCQFGSEVWRSLLLLGKQGESLYEQWNSAVVCSKIIIMLLFLWMLTGISELWNDVSTIINCSTQLLMSLIHKYYIIIDCHCSCVTDYLCFAFTAASVFLTLSLFDEFPI